MSNAQSMEKIWNIPGLQKVRTKNPDHYRACATEAQKKMRTKAADNSASLLRSEEKLEAERKKGKMLDQEVEAAEQIVSNLKIQRQAVTDKMKSIKQYEIQTVKQESVQLVNEATELNEQESMLIGLLSLPLEERFLGLHGGAGEEYPQYLRNLSHMHSVGDAKNNTASYLRGVLSYGALLGVETNARFLRLWENQDHKAILGSTPGVLLSNNDLSHERLVDIAYLVLELSPVETPSPTKKTTSSGVKRRRKSSGFKQKKSRRLSFEEAATIKNYHAIMEKVAFGEIDGTAVTGDHDQEEDDDDDSFAY